MGCRMGKRGKDGRWIMIERVGRWKGNRWKIKKKKNQRKNWEVWFSGMTGERERNER